jgi:hypothetical protein
MRVGRIMVPLLVMFVAAACTRVVDGTDRPARGLAPRPLTGESVFRVLLDDSELSKMIGQPLKSNDELPMRFGGRELIDGLDALPGECAGVEFELQPNTYRNADVQTVAQESWWTVSYDDVRVISVWESVAALPSAPAADALFTTLVGQWNRCNGSTVTTDFPSGGGPPAVISDVRAANSVLAATVDQVDAPGITSARAVGVRANCLVEVKVDYFSNDRPDDTAIDIAHRLMNKVSGLS